MALEAVVFPQDPLTTTTYYSPTSFLRPDYSSNYPFADLQLDEDDPCHYSTGTNCCWDVHPPNTSSEETAAAAGGVLGGDEKPPEAGGGRRKRRRVKSTKNREEIENQRMTHIAVERNRRKQMNEYLAVLRSLMPPSYSQRGDQASIIGGAINFVKELEQLLQSMETTTTQKIITDEPVRQQPFLGFFSFPQYSTRAAAGEADAESATAAVADIEVTMVESHANLKIQSRKRPKQLLKLVAGLQALRLVVLHLNVTSSGDTALYTVSVKVEEGCHLATVDEIAAAVNQMFRRIEEELPVLSAN